MAKKALKLRGGGFARGRPSVPAGPPVQNGIATINGQQYVLGNLNAIGKGSNLAAMNKAATEFQTRMAGKTPLQAAKNGAIGAPRTGQWLPLNTLTPNSYNTYNKSWSSTPGYKPIAPQMAPAFASKDPTQIAAAHYSALQSLPAKGQGFGSFLLKMLPQVALAAVPGAGPYLSAAYGGVTNGLKGGPLAGLVGAASGYGMGQTFGNINAAGGLGNFVGNKVASGMSAMANPMAAARSLLTSTGSAVNPFGSAVKVIGGVPKGLVANKKRAGGMVKGLAPYGNKT